MLRDKISHSLCLVEIHVMEEGFQVSKVGSKTKQLEVDLLSLSSHIEAIIGHHP